MAQQFDDLLSNRFREVFEQYNEPYDAANWLSMKEKLAQNKQKKVFFLLPFLKVASIVLLVASTAFVTYKLTVYSQKMNAQVFENNADKEEIVLETNQKDNPKSTNFLTESVMNAENKTTATKSVQMNQNEPILSKTDEYLKQNEQKNEFILEKIDKQARLNIAIKLDTFSVKPIQMKANQQLYLVDNSDLLVEEKKKKKKFQMGAKVSSFYNFSENQSSGDANLGLGFVSEYKVSKHIGVNSGVFFAKNTLQNDGALNNMFANKNEDFLSDQASVGASVVVETNYAFYSLDIPLNLYFYHKKAFVSGGISSFFYINEQIENTVYSNSIESVLNPTTNVYEMQSVVNSSSNVQTRESFKVFDFAKMINLSVGYKLGRKKNNLMIEPYAKIPVGKLTSSQIAFGLAGVSVRYNF